MEYVRALNEVVNLCKFSILEKLIVILQLQDPDAPVPASDIASIAGVKELNKAAETFAGRNDQRVKSSLSFFFHAQRHKIPRNEERGGAN